MVAVTVSRRPSCPSSIRRQYGRLGLPADPIAFQNGATPGTPGGEKLARDLALSPRSARSTPEKERLPLAGLVDHLLVELADTTTTVCEEDAEEP